MGAPKDMAKSIVVGGCASCAASVFTNPLEVAKSRFQVQGELGAAGRPYRHVLQALLTISRSEGLCALQKGLVAAWGYQFVGNGTRLAAFDQIKAIMGGSGSSNSFAASLGSGALAGTISSTVAQPFYLVKVRLQVASSAHAIGEQHSYSSLRDGFRSVVRRDGILGLWKGLDGMVLRSVVASSVQLATYNEAKTWLAGRLGVGDQPLVISFLASLTAGLAITTAMEPFDVAATRLCNQRDATYSGVIDCLSKTFKAEGILGLYKGWASNYARMAPHTTLMFLFWEQFKVLADRVA